MEYEYKLLSEETARRIYREHVALYYTSKTDDPVVAVGKVVWASYNYETDSLVIKLEYIAELYAFNKNSGLRKIELIESYYDSPTIETLEDIEAGPELPETKVEPFELRDANGKTVLGQSHITINLTVDDKLSEQWTEQKVGEMVSNRLFWKLMNTDKQE